MPGVDDRGSSRPPHTSWSRRSPPSRGGRGATARLGGASPGGSDRLLAVVASAGDQLARLADDLLTAARGAAAGPPWARCLRCSGLGAGHRRGGPGRGAGRDDYARGCRSASACARGRGQAPAGGRGPGVKTRCDTAGGRRRCPSGATDEHVQVAVADPGPASSLRTRSVSSSRSAAPGAAPGGSGIGLSIAAS